MSSILPRTIADGFTQSELTVLSDCPTKWHLKYNLLLTKGDDYSFPLMVGTIIHDSLEQIYKTSFKRYNVDPVEFPEGAIPTIGDISKAKYWNEVVPKMIDAYVNYWRVKDAKDLQIISLEESLSIVYRGFILRGKIDLTAILKKTKRIIIDHKSSSKLNYDTVIGFDYRFQFLFYLWLKWKDKPKEKFYGYAVNVIKKPELRPKQNEGFPEFALRVFSDMVANPEKYFYRETYQIGLANLQYFQDTVVDPKLDRIQLGIDQPDLFPILFGDKNTSECQRLGQAPCIYYDYCRQGEDKVGHLYHTKSVKHPELEVEVE